ncbi:MAG TPA: hypothetical protein VK762_11945 [Polyangiaceae bacterium]|jgi:hypothetical protein|nr:hypothetical protein [Polyangiaceae bacterium]
MKRIALAFSSALLCACEAVPTLTFAPPDAAEDGSLAPTDAGVEGGCPTPASAQTPFVCCGTVTCEGQCAGQCVSCMNKCTSPGEFCCAKTNNVMCLSAGSICH